MRPGLGPARSRVSTFAQTTFVRQGWNGLRMKKLWRIHQGSNPKAELATKSTKRRKNRKDDSGGELVSSTLFFGLNTKPSRSADTEVAEDKSECLLIAGIASVRSVSELRVLCG